MSGEAGRAAERLLRAAVDPRGHGPLPWVAAPILDAGRVLDVACGAGPLAEILGRGWVGIDRSPAANGRRPVLRATAEALPIRTNAADAACLLLALPLISDLDAVFAELRRVLRPGGTLIAMVPSISVRSRTELRLAALLRPVRRARWPNRSALDNVAWLFAAADFAVLGDDRVPFAVPLPDADAVARVVADLPLAGLWPPGLPADVVDGVAAGLARWAGPGRALPLPLRRLVARR